MRQEDLSSAHILVLEYKHLKQEQLGRISTRDNLLYVTFASLAAVVAATLQVHVGELLLVLPPVCFVLGWTYLMNDVKISAIGRYIRRVLTPQLNQLLQSETPIFSWDAEHRTDSGRRFRKIGQLIVDISTFCVPALLAIIAFQVTGIQTVVTMVVATVEVIGIIALTIAIVARADFATAP